MKLKSVMAAMTLAATFPDMVLAQDITPIADVQRGTNVTVAGTVERITDEDEFIIADTSGSIRVYIGPGIVPVDSGEQITLTGLVDNDIVWQEIYARTITRADGTELTFDHRYD